MTIVDQRSWVMRFILLAASGSLVLTLFLLLPVPASAQTMTATAGETRSLLLEQGPWSLSSTGGDPEDAGAHWNTYPVRFEAIAGKITINYLSAFFGAVVTGVEIKASGFAWSPPTGGTVEMRTVNVPASYQFTGSSNGYTYRLARQ